MFLMQNTPQFFISQYKILFFFVANFEHMKKSGDYYVIVVEDTHLGQIVATATLIIEHKFIHACAKVIDLIFNYLILNTCFAIELIFIVRYYIIFCPGRGGV